jgi:hypothetical protein
VDPPALWAVKGPSNRIVNLFYPLNNFTKESANDKPFIPVAEAEGVEIT